MHTPIAYPAFEPPLSTDLMTSVALTGTNHAEDQPVHLRVVPTAAYSARTGAAAASSPSESPDACAFLNPATGAGSPAVRTLAGTQVAENGMDDGEGAAWVADESATRSAHVRTNVDLYAGLLGRACPAGVYEYVEEEGSADAATGDAEGSWKGHKLVINSQVRNLICGRCGLWLMGLV